MCIRDRRSNRPVTNEWSLIHHIKDDQNETCPQNKTLDRSGSWLCASGVRHRVIGAVAESECATESNRKVLNIDRQTEAGFVGCGTSVRSSEARGHAQALLLAAGPG